MINKSSSKSLRNKIHIIIYLLLIITTWSYSQEHLNELNKKPQINDDGKRFITATKTIEELNINGFFNEPAWDSVQFQGGFIQREPNEGSGPTEKTEIGVLFDKQNLYFGIKCYDTNPDKIVAREMRRDAIVDNDDFFEMIIDTYHDHRTGYYFIFNAHGSKRDAVLADESRNFNAAWDGVWECKTQITNEGWFAEIAIPWKTIRFSEKDSTEWGLILRE